MPEYRGAILDDTGTAVSGATVEIYDINTTTPVRATTTSDASGLWAISHSTRGRFDVKVTNGSDIVWLRARDRFQVDKMQAESDADAPIVGTQVEDANSVQVAIFEGDRATPADGDLAYISLQLSDSAGNQDEQARIAWSATTVSNGATQDGDLILSALVNGSLTEMVRLDGSQGLWLATVDLKFNDSVNLIFGTGGDATIQYNGTNLVISPAVVGTGELVLTGASLFVGDTANADMTQGITINQGANDDQVLAFKSSDIAHGRTTIAETDTFAMFRKNSATLGGLRQDILAEDDALTTTFQIVARGGTADTTKTTSGVGLVSYNVAEISGDADADITADGNVFTVRATVGSSTVTRFLVDEDGDLYSVTAAQTFDDYDDLALIDTYDRVRSGYMEWAKEHEEQLIAIKVLGGPVAEGGLTNLSQLSRLLTGAIRQIGTRLELIESRLALTEGN